MCGILGGVVRESCGLDAETIRAALSLLRHRGPDAEGLYLNSDVFLGHRRLSIVDLDPRANQPFHVGPLVISFNGEIYNHRELRAELERYGHRFVTRSDTEVLLTAYMQFGKECLSRLEGMFAFAIWDERERSFFLARDRFGEKPLFCYHDDRQFLFSSEIFPIRLLVGTQRLEEDRASLGLYFLFSYIPAPFAPYRKMLQIKPGCWLKFDAVKWSTIRGRYYDLGDTVRTGKVIEYTEATEILRKNLDAAVQTRFVTSDVPVATFLSGGIDSSVITILAARATTEPITAYSVTFPHDQEFDESHYAIAVAKTLPNLRHKVIRVTEDTLDQFVDATLGRLSEPLGDASLIPTAYLCSQVEEKVILGGDGADELFGGYGVYPAMIVSSHIPRIVKHALCAMGQDNNPHAIRHPLLRAWALLRRHLRGSLVDEYLSWRQYAALEDLQMLGFGDVHLSEIVSQVGIVESGRLRDIQLADFRFNLPNDMLKKVDYASMFHSLEVRLPFLDSKLVEWVLSLPDSYKIKWWRRKRILRDAFATLLPEIVLNRRKQGFLLPLRRWFRTGRLHEQLRSLIDSQTLFDPELPRKRLIEHVKGVEDNSVFLWSLLVYLRWRQV
jgi:asparagine synthase (glutamine-hydrolysing)